MNIFNFTGVLSSSAEKVGIRGKQNTYYYRFKDVDVSGDIDLLENSFVQKNGYTYIDGFAKFRFRSALVLCYGENDSCIDLSNLKYKRIPKKQLKNQKEFSKK